ncbi:glycosyltransferase family 39 protein [Quisquiliibacterium transsilvanicum]|uniref:4-amino-4-deoxy-L-arabinose transferase-like glycosyltransferase n=1 Tax=Quisquiliibacterium transsilvanicum TaxID=1549638 RepID=A0A7W8HGC9_9BURK|nr:glycosyltransferase family 39 protein [Quisquiliibacterium transsilvanicum]MBB5271592.1 4-amino-4-deoxy-L-arabinose transferase-like glycosyltransferase [Quisquiliibacterium transsilvanicum]
MAEGRAWSLSWGLASWSGLAVLYLLFNVATQLAASPTANFDQAEMLVLAQELRLGYTAQPPLYVWLNWLPDALAGPSLALNLALKCLLMGASVALSLAALRDAGAARRQAPLVLAGFALIPVVIWEAQRVLTHSALAVALVLATLWLAQRLRASPTRLGYLAWGLLGGAALIAKYNTAIALAALVGALLLAPGWRVVLLTPRLAWAALGAALAVLPHLAWLAGNRSAVGSTMRKLERSADPFGSVAGLAELSGALAACVGLMAIVWISVRALRWLRRAAPGPAARGRADLERGDARILGAGGAAHAVAPAVPAPRAAALLRLVSLQLVLGVALTAVFVVVSGSRHFEERWLLPVLAPLPLWLALVVRRADLRIGMLAVGAAMALAAALMLPGRVFFAEQLARGRPAVVSLPYVALAADMRAAHGEPVAILADTQTLGGNLRLVFPRARILVPGVTRHEAPAEGALWAVFEDSDCEGRPLTERVGDQGLLPLPGVPCTVHEATLLHHRARTHRLHLQVLRAR